MSEEVPRDLIAEDLKAVREDLERIDLAWKNKSKREGVNYREEFERLMSELEDVAIQRSRRGTEPFATLWEDMWQTFQDNKSHLTYDRAARYSDEYRSESDTRVHRSEFRAMRAICEKFVAVAENLAAPRETAVES